MQLQLRFFPYLSILTCVLGAQKNRLIESVLSSTHNICFGLEVRKYFSNMRSYLEACGINKIHVRISTLDRHYVSRGFF